MANPVTIAIIGAGSATFSGGVIRDLCVHRGLHGSHIRLMDLDRRRLENVCRMGERLSGELKTELSFSKTTDRAQALAGADFVLNTAQAGGHD
ncbi:MAG: hypothetical protein IT210_25165 [Armatimonadetes bacterium]|nr:hypothetical protein [Armatimonadota bacterium]